MDVSGVGSSAVSMVTGATPQAVASVAMQKKAMEMEQQMAAQLVQSIAQSAPKTASTGSVGSNIDIVV